MPVGVLQFGDKDYTKRAINHLSNMAVENLPTMYRTSHPERLGDVIRFYIILKAHYHADSSILRAT